MNEHDIELLKAAAKAMSGKYTCGNCADGSMAGYFYVGDDVAYWNPLDDDGDAFRLMVSLGMDVCVNTEEFEVYADDYREPILVKATIATRRAIVRAAAHIGGHR